LRRPILPTCWLHVLLAINPVSLHLLVICSFQVVPPFVTSIVAELVGTTIVGNVVCDCLPGDVVGSLCEFGYCLLEKLVLFERRRLAFVVYLQADTERVLGHV
jgi:hypothetical protein